MTPTETNLETCRELAKLFTENGLIGGSPKMVLLAITVGAEFGLTPYRASRLLTFKDGKPMVSGETFLGILYARNEPANISLEENENSVTCSMQRTGREFHSETVNFKHPSEMLRAKWEAVKRCAAFLFPDLTSGLEIYAAPENSEIAEIAGLPEEKETDTPPENTSALVPVITADAPARVAADLVFTKKTDYYVCTATDADGDIIDYRITRDKTNKLHCNCENFTQHFKKNPAYRCSHISAFREFMLNGSKPKATVQVLIKLNALAKDLGADLERESQARYACSQTEMTQDQAEQMLTEMTADLLALTKQREAPLPEWAKGKTWHCRGDLRRTFIELIEDLHTLFEAEVPHAPSRTDSLETLASVKHDAPFSFSTPEMENAVEKLKGLINRLTNAVKAVAFFSQPL